MTYAILLINPGRWQQPIGVVSLVIIHVNGCVSLSTIEFCQCLTGAGRSAVSDTVSSAQWQGSAGIDPGHRRTLSLPATGQSHDSLHIIVAPLKLWLYCIEMWTVLLLSLSLLSFVSLKQINWQWKYSYMSRYDKAGDSSYSHPTFT